jgi:hypothetical protein
MHASFWLGGCVSVVVVAAAACGSAGQGKDNGSGGNGNANGNGGTSSHGGAGGASSGGAGDTGGSTGTLTFPDSGTGDAACPAYQSCTDLGLNCGMAPDGCGNLQDCGSCTAPETCAGGGTQNVCGKPSCIPQTCASQGFTCGSATDTCGGMLSCGTCAANQTCGAQQPNVCGTGICTPMTCAQQGYNCGSQGDGCGNVLDCGTCSTNQVCGGGLNPQTGVCGTEACVSQTCAQQGFNCGSATDTCGAVLNCGTCPTDQMCGGGGPNVCGGTSCPAGSELVYVWDLDNNIYSFDPPSKTFTKVAVPDCDASSPNSMAIDRNLVAWLNYLSPGNSSPNDYIYTFDLKKGSGCTASGIQIPAGYTQVGMGFSSDTPGGNTETLYVDGISGAGLASVDMTTKTIVPIGDFPNDTKLEGQSCELTGTGSALLYGYFTTSPYVRVAQLNKTNSDSISDTQLKGFTPPDDWAFSFWGGDFYLYAYPNSSNAPNSSVIQYDPVANTLNLAYIANVGFTIIGAGVSTCAPTTPCVPKTCAQANATCGPAGDGCGNIIQCGSCSVGQACVAGACTTGCTPKTCADEGFTCGMQGDGCGNALNCGTCPSGQTCNAGKCGSGTCMPESCTQQGYACGSVGDGCGNIQNCGTCPQGEVCGGMTPGQCYKPPCTPKTCSELGYNCGQATDGCGTVINCGTCSGTQTCGGGGVANVCGGVN